MDDHDLDGRLPYLALLAERVSLMQAEAAHGATPVLERAAAGARAAGDDDLFVLTPSSWARAAATAFAYDHGLV